MGEVPVPAIGVKSAVPLLGLWGGTTNVRGRSCIIVETQAGGGVKYGLRSRSS